MSLRSGLLARLLPVLVYAAAACGLILAVQHNAASPQPASAPATGKHAEPATPTQMVTIHLLVSAPVDTWNVTLNSQPIASSAHGQTFWEGTVQWPADPQSRLVVDLVPAGNPAPFVPMAVRIALQAGSRRWETTAWGQSGVTAAVTSADAPVIFATGKNP